MNSLLRLIASFGIVLSVFFVQHVHAQENETPNIEITPKVYLHDGQSDSPEVTFTVLADVSVESAAIWEQNGHDVVIEFDLINNGNPEPEILYAAQLYKEIISEGKVIGDILVHEYVYPDVVHLDKGAVVHKQITYTVPNIFEGEYILRILVANKQGFEYGGTTLGKVIFSGGQIYGEEYIDPSTCSLSIKGDDTIYSLLHGADINTGTETLLLRCRDTVYATYESATPHFVFRERSAFGDIVLETIVLRDDMEVVDGDMIEVFVPLPTKPQSYLVKMDFVTDDGKPLSNEVTFRTVVQGESATIKNATLDKSSYTTGEEAVVKLVASGYADIFPGARGNDAYEFESTGTDDLSITVQIVSNGLACSDVQTISLPVNKGGLFETSVSIINDCAQPTVSAFITNKENKVLSDLHSNGTTVETIPTPSESSYSVFEIGVMLVFILIFLIGLGVFMVHNNKKIKETSTVLLLIFVFGFGLLGPQNVSATTFVIDLSYLGALMSYTGWYNLSDSDIPCGASVTGNAKMELTGCGNTAVNADIAIDGVTMYSHFHDELEYSLFGFTLDTGWVSRTVGPKTTAGNVKFDFTIASTDPHNPSYDFVDTLTQASNFTVGLCAGFTEKVDSNTGCAVLGDPTKNASVDVSISNSTILVDIYGFKCSTQDWVYQAGSTYTCVFDGPGTKTIGYYVKTTTGQTLTKNISVLVQDCNADFTPNATVLTCAIPSNGTEEGQIGASITSPNVTVTQYGFKCGSKDWVYQSGNAYVCKFEDPGVVNIKYSIKDTFNIVTIKELNPTVNMCASTFVPELGPGVGCARAGDDTKNALVDVSVSSSSLAITEYGFKCGSENDWVYQTGDSYTCVFKTPGYKVITYSVKDINDNVNTATRSITIQSCDITFTHSAVPTSICATAGNSGENGTFDLSITNPNVSPVVQYGFTCGLEPEVTQTGNTSTCTFDAPGDYFIQYSAQDTYGNVGTAFDVVSVAPCNCFPATASIDINGITGSADVAQDAPFTINSSFTSPNSTYSCTLETPIRSPLTDSVAVGLVDSTGDTLPDAGALPSDAAINPYTLMCVSAHCPSVSATVNANILPPAFTVQLDTVPVNTLDVLSPVTWSIIVDGGVPFDIGEYEVNWAGNINDFGWYTNPDGTPNDSIRHKTTQFSTLGTKSVTVTVTDKWGQSASATKTITVEDNRDPQ